MIRSFEQIKNLGVFSDYKNPSTLNVFEKFNLIYGTNGSGKTTLSRFFFDLNNGNAPGFPDLKYKIRSDEGDFKNGQPYGRTIKVFNSEFVHSNLQKIEIDGKVNPIYVLGEDNKELAKQVKEDEGLLEDKKREIIRLSGIRQEFDKRRGASFTSIARKISERTSGIASRNYNKSNAVKQFDAIESFEEIPPSELNFLVEGLKQTRRELITDLKFSDPNFFFNLHKVKTDIHLIVQQSANAIAIERLIQNPSLLSWVEAGHKIHKTKDECQYCLQKVPDSRRKQLNDHFNDQDRILRDSILDILKQTGLLLVQAKELNFPSSEKFYVESKESYSENRSAVREEIELLKTHLTKLENILNEKLLRRNESYDAPIESFQDTKLIGSLDAIGDIIDITNAKTQNYEKSQKESRSKIERHYLSTIRTQIDEFDKEINDLDTLITELKNGTDEVAGTVQLEARIQEYQGKLSDAHRGADELSKKLATFLGRGDLKFISEDQGYRIERYGRPAQKLSEGERTAIMFLYFVVSLNEQNFVLNDSIIVIDDPISSLDSSSIYQAFAFLKNAVSEAHQVFIFTHNFNFLKLLLGWFKNIRKAEGKKSYYMLVCESKENERKSTINKLDDVLLSTDSENHYLFSTLNHFKSDGTIASSYHIPNIIRKVLETFLENHSSGSSLYSKLKLIDFDEQKKGALYKYSNDLSHSTFSNFDPALIPETQNNVQTLFDMMEVIAPVHFNALVESTK